MDIRVESGRAFTTRDLAGPAVAIVAASTARRFWPGESPIGKHVRFVGDARLAHRGRRRGRRAWLRSDAQRARLDEGTVYVPHNAVATLEDGRIPTEMMLTLRTSVPAAQVRRCSSARRRR